VASLRNTLPAVEAHPPAIGKGGAHRAWLKQQAADLEREAMATAIEPPLSHAIKAAALHSVPVIAVLAGSAVNGMLLQRPMQSLVGDWYLGSVPAAALGALGLVMLETATGMRFMKVWQAPVPPRAPPSTASTWWERWRADSRSWRERARLGCAWACTVAAIEVGLAYLRDKLLRADAISKAALLVNLASDEDARKAALAAMPSPHIDWWSLAPQMVMGAALPVVLTIIATELEPFGEALRIIGVHCSVGRLRRQARRIRERLAKMDDREARRAATRARKNAGAVISAGRAWLVGRACREGLPGGPSAVDGRPHG
jgi:hypothetical protein